MLIYQNTTEKFIQDVRENHLTDIMIGTFKERIGRQPGFAEVNSWQNSLPRVRDLIELAGLKDNQIAIEYEVPYNQNRIDCLLFGKGLDRQENIVLIELKQWQSVEPLNDEGNFVETYTGGSSKVVAHPSQQVEGYHNFLKYFVSEFEKQPPLILFSCSYCHNYKKQEGEGLFAPKFKKIIENHPLYSKDDAQLLADKIKNLLASGNGFEIFNRFMQSPIQPSQKLLDHVSAVIQNKAVFSLLNEQLVAKNLILSKIRRSKKTKTKSVIIVHGGPGTGKSLIAINLLAEAAHSKYKVFYGCKSKPFIEGIKNLVGPESEILFSNLYRFVPSKIKSNELDLLLIDEAHRIGNKSNFQFTKAEDRTDMPQIDQLIRCAKTVVFFIDDKQNVRSQEIGGSELIRETAEKQGCSIDTVELVTQFRCMGSNDYLLWLESVLGYQSEKRLLRKDDKFEFRIFDTPQEMYKELQKREEEKPNSARIVAGYCWPWSKKLDGNGQLVNDVRIGNFAMPWETHGDITRPPEGYVRWYEWAYKPEGFKQVGCIYTAQGFEFDYIGVIIGNDLVYDAPSDSLKADISATEDRTLKMKKESFETYVRNIYRTLLSRAMRGCYVYFTNKETENFFRSRMEISQAQVQEKVVPLFRKTAGNEAFKTLLPVYSLKAAAGYFGKGEAVEPEGWVEAKGLGRLNERMFVAQVVGRSMEPKIKDGDYCVFRANPEGSRQGKIVLAQYRGPADPDTGGSYTVKLYSSKKTVSSDETWKHEEITLLPLNVQYQPIKLKPENENDIQILGEFIAIL